VKEWIFHKSEKRRRKRLDNPLSLPVLLDSTPRSLPPGRPGQGSVQVLSYTPVNADRWNSGVTQRDRLGFGPDTIPCWGIHP